MTKFNQYRRRFLRTCRNQGVFMGLGKPVLAASLASASGSACSGNVPEIKRTGMDLGINLGWITTWSGGIPFANLCYQMSPFVQIAGSGAFTQNQGSLIASVPSDIFRGELLNGGSALPSGRYTVINPDGCEIGFGSFNPGKNPEYHRFTRATNFSFDYKTGNYLGLFVRGSLTRQNGNLVVLLPDTTESWAAGNIWNPDFLAYHQELGAKVFRTMDWTQASSNLETDWADRSKSDQISFSNPIGGFIGRLVPWEVICDLANRLEKDPWICIPHRATADYVKQLAVLLKKHLNPGLKPWVELANEIWNVAAPWANGSNWINTLAYTRQVASADHSAGVFRLAAHGLVTGSEVRSFSTKENRLAGVSEDWRASFGTNTFVEVIDENSFKLHWGSASGPVVSIVPGQKNLLFINMNEPGKPGYTAKVLDANYGSVSVRNWDILRTELGERKFVKLLGSFFDDYTIRRVAAAPAADFVAIAPYFGGNWWGGVVDISDATLTPGVWSNSAASVRFSLFPELADPSLSDIKNGRGAINHQSLEYSSAMTTAVDATHSTRYTSFSPVSGLTNGASYRLFIVLTDANGYDWSVSALVSPSASPGKKYLEDSFSNQSLRNQINALVSASFVSKTLVAAGGIPLVCYEGGLHFHERPPPNLKLWLERYQESPEFSEAIDKYLHMLSNTGASAFCYFSDVTGISFQLSKSYSGTRDLRFLKYASFKGHVPARKQMFFQDVLATNIEKSPIFPYVVYTFPDASLKYSLINGDLKGNYAINGNLLQMANGSQVDFGLPANVVLTIGVTDGVAFQKFKVSFATGNSWFASDAKYVWSSIADTNTTQITPIIGNPIPLISGSAGKQIDGMWDLAGAVYSRPALTSPFSDRFGANTSWMIAVCLDQATQMPSYKSILNIAGVDFVWVSANDFKAHLWTGRSLQNKFSDKSPSGKHVFWVFHDGKRFYTGMDQVSFGYVEAEIPATLTLDSKVTIGGSESHFRYGSQQMISRPGMRISDVLSIVKKMQIYHGIGLEINTMP